MKTSPTNWRGGGVNLVERVATMDWPETARQLGNHRDSGIASLQAPIESSNLMVSPRAPARSIVAACLLAASIQLNGQRFGGD